jgi:hypothetical protein
VRIHPTSVADNGTKKKVIFIGCLEAETPACSSFDVYSAVLCVQPQILLKVAGIHSADDGSCGANPQKPADEAFSRYSAPSLRAKRTIAAPGIDQKLRAAGYLLKEADLLKQAQQLAVQGKLSPGQMTMVGQQALSRQIYDDLFKLSLMKLNQPHTLQRLAQTERAKQEALNTLTCGVKDLYQYKNDINRIELELQNRRDGLAAAVGREIQNAEAGPICVLCGLLEKAAIGEYLTKQEGLAIELFEYWLVPTA